MCGLHIESLYVDEEGERRSIDQWEQEEEEDEDADKEDEERNDEEDEELKIWRDLH